MTELRIVVGSGPTSIAVTSGLLARGFDVVMLDVGEQLDEATANIVARMGAQEPEQWSKTDKAAIQRIDYNTDLSFSPKRAFGSPYAYFNDPRIVAPAGMRLYGSLAFGGLSTVWGCALLKAGAGDLANWPEPVSKGVAEAYRKIADLVQKSTGADILAAGTHLKISTAAQRLLERFRALGIGPEVADLYPTPLAISTACKACNACMYGCVYGFTYDSRTTIRNLFNGKPGFRYISGLKVERYLETVNGVEVHAVGAGGRTEIFRARQLFLAAGMMSTLRIVWNSSAQVSRHLQIRDSSSFLIPGFILSAQNLRGGKHHGLSHLSIDLKLPPFDERPAHVQLYFNNPAVVDGLTARLGRLAVHPVRGLIKFAGRFLVGGQGYLHSDFCNRLIFRYDDTGAIRVAVEHNAANKMAIDSALSQFVAQMRALGAIMIKPAASVIAYGGSKTAGALPHAAAPDSMATDLLGRPFGAQNVYLVDGTVLPSIPARNHTLTMMANALRIGESA
jgi:hypothetical protein